MDATNEAAAKLPHTAKRKPGQREIAAAAFGISPRMVDFAETVIKTGIPELQAACRAGQISVSRAAKIAKESPAEQLRLLNEAINGPKRTAKPAARLLKLAKDVDAALGRGDHDAALRHARDLRAAADAVCMALMPLVIGVVTYELSEVVDG